MLSTRRTRIALAFLAVNVALAGGACDEPPPPPPVVPGDDDAPDPPDPDVVVDCANADAATTAEDLEQMATRFATDDGQGQKHQTSALLREAPGLTRHRSA